MSVGRRGVSPQPSFPGMSLSSGPYSPVWFTTSWRACLPLGSSIRELMPPAQPCAEQPVNQSQFSIPSCLLRSPLPPPYSQISIISSLTADPPLPPNVRSQFRLSPSRTKEKQLFGVQKQRVLSCLRSAQISKIGPPPILRSLLSAASSVPHPPSHPFSGD